MDNIAAGKSPIGFFKALGELLQTTIGEMQAQPEQYRHERSVLSVYLDSGALGRHDDEALVGLLSMTLMAAVFNTQVSLAWILVHLYDDPSLLQQARDEIALCPDLADYAELEKLPFLNSCIDEAVRLHTMLPGNTVLRKTKRELQLGSHTVAAGSVLWLYPNAVHLDEGYFPEPKAFCPMRLLHGNLEKMTDNFELVTFGHGQKRCIGEKMARAMILTFLAKALPAIDADPPDELPDDGFFDLIPASQLRLKNLRAHDPSAPAGVATQRPSKEMAAAPAQSWAAVAVDQAADVARDAAREAAKAGRSLRWEFWLAMWRSWTSSADWREKTATALGWKDFCDGVGAVADRVSRIVQLERILAVDIAADDREQPPPEERA